MLKYIQLCSGRVGTSDRVVFILLSRHQDPPSLLKTIPNFCQPMSAPLTTSAAFSHEKLFCHQKPVEGLIQDSNHMVQIDPLISEGHHQFSKGDISQALFCSWQQHKSISASFLSRQSSNILLTRKTVQLKTTNKTNLATQRTCYKSPSREL